MLQKSRELSLPLVLYKDAPEKDPEDPSPLSTKAKLSTITEDDEISVRRGSTESVSTFSHDDPQSEGLLNHEPKLSKASAKRWLRIYRSWSGSRPVKTISPVLLALVPSFFRKSEKRKLYPTSYLDGLRGVAAFFVTQVKYSIPYSCPISHKV
jgi:hypothetical protein